LRAPNHPNPPSFAGSPKSEPPTVCRLRSTIVRDDDLRRALTDANPWWRAAAHGTDPVAWVGAHRLLLDRAEHDLGYRSSVLDDLATVARIDDRLVVLTGPRRVGKSVALLDVAAALCARPDIDPRQVVHLPCDGFATRDLRRALTLGRELTRVIDQASSTPRVWLLDEVSSIDGWTPVLKSARDGTAFGDDTVVATGSRWSGNDDVEGNLLAGRAGRAESRRVRHLLPMSFRAFVTATRPDLARPDVVHPARLHTEQVAETLEGLRFDIDAYDFAWQDYLTCGGFPRAVFEHTRIGAVSNSFLHDLAAWLRRDVDRDAPAESIPLLLDGLARRATSPLNQRSTAVDLGYTYDSLSARLAKLVRNFAAIGCPQRDDNGRIVRGSQSKLYLSDPILSWLPGRLHPGCGDPEMTMLTEATIATHLARAIDDLDEGRLVVNDTIGYARTGAGNEIDLLPVPVSSTARATRTVPIEAKWVDDRWRSAAKTVEAKYDTGILATKSILDTSHPTWAIPAPLLALLLL
jgi:uncharacterized protein